MTLSADAVALLDTLPDPALLLRTDGRVDHANRAAMVHFGKGIVGGSLCDACADPADLRSFLVRASGSRQPLPGRLRLRPETGPAAFRAFASVLRPASPDVPAAVLVRLLPTEDQRFQALTSKVRELNAEVRRRQHAQAVLEETLQERNLLLRELHHRVKNNMQMLAGILASAERETMSPEAKAVLADASQRLVAVGAVQQMLYGSDSFSGVRSEEFIETITAAILKAQGQPIKIVTHADSAQLANDLAIPVSLILNELVTNALKHGRPPDGRAEIRVSLEFENGEYRLTVADNGPGFDLVESRKRASGLGLVRGLVRQLGGTLAVERTPGARVLVRFYDRSQARPGRVAA